MAKLTLPQLERHLFAAADIFEMLFLKCASDVFEKRYQEIIQENLARGRSEEEARKRAESALRYRETFFVPEKAR
jgi:type I restriction enzyme M protein